jgi:uncharacterized SAM-binding protein YcdF (DUF218 family)
MLFLLSKIAGFLTLPSNAIAVLGALGVFLLIVNRRRIGIYALISAVIALVIFGFAPVSNVMLLTLSERFPAWQADGQGPDGIIILGGAIDSELSAARERLEVDSSADRIFAMLDLARRYPTAKIVFSGGSGNLFQNSVPEAPFAGRLLEQFGLGNNRVILESVSRTTAENAAETRKLVTPQHNERWLLVTSAFHMPRAMAAFRGVGFNVEAYPVDFRTAGWQDAWKPFDKISAGLARSDVAVHEWIGLIGLRLTGRSSELLPSPKSAPASVLTRQP